MAKRRTKPGEQVEVVLDVERLDQPATIGTLHRQVGRKGLDQLSFEYDSEWLRSGHAFEIDPALVLSGGRLHPESRQESFGVFTDSAPDRWGQVLLNRRERQRAEAESREIRTLRKWDYLLGVHDETRIGALRFRRDGNSAFLDDDPVRPAPPMTSLRELEEESRKFESEEAGGERSPASEWRSVLIAQGSSLGGARPKANVLDGRGRIWIAKFPSINDTIDVGAWEYVVHELARDSGIRVAEARIEKFTSHGHTFMTRRFDRTDSGRRVFFQSALTVLQQTDGTDDASYLDLVAALTSQGASPAEDLEQLFRRLVFNVCVSNTDDHLRNHGFIRGPDGITLSPAYDLNPTPEKRHHAIGIDEDDPTSDLDVVRRTAGYYEMTTDGAERIISEVASVVREWRDRADAIGLPRAHLEQMTPAFKQAEALRD